MLLHVRLNLRLTTKVLQTLCFGVRGECGQANIKKHVTLTLQADKFGSGKTEATRPRMIILIARMCWLVILTIAWSGRSQTWMMFQGDMFGLVFVRAIFNWANRSRITHITELLTFPGKIGTLKYHHVHLVAGNVIAEVLVYLISKDVLKNGRAIVDLLPIGYGVMEQSRCYRITPRYSKRHEYLSSRHPTAKS